MNHFSKKPIALRRAAAEHQAMGELVKRLPQGGRLIEPFLTDGRLLSGTRFKNYLLGSNNQAIINFYQMLATWKEEFIKRANKYFVASCNSQEAYEYFLFTFNEISLMRANSCAELNHACLFLYLNQHGCLTSLNDLQGKNLFQFGCRKKVSFPREALLALLARINSCSVTFSHNGWRATLNQAVAGDVVYCCLPSQMAFALSGVMNKHTNNFHLQVAQELLYRCDWLQEHGVNVIVTGPRNVCGHQIATNNRRFVVWEPVTQ